MNVMQKSAKANNHCTCQYKLEKVMHTQQNGKPRD